MKKYIFVICFCLVWKGSNLFSAEMENTIRYFYGKNQASSKTSYEAFLVEHARESLEKAFSKKSKLEAASLYFSPHVFHHLLNNLCALSCASYLHQGLGKGDTFISALFGNIGLLLEKRGISKENTDLDLAFYDNCAYSLSPNSYEILIADLNESTIPVDIYVYDPYYPISPLENSIVLSSNFSSAFIVVVDDWEWEWVREEIFAAFDLVGYEILSEQEVRASSDFGNGQYIAVLRRPEI
jgi:hypothetical protein